MLPVYLDCPLLIATSVLSNVYYHYFQNNKLTKVKMFPGLRKAALRIRREDWLARFNIVCPNEETCLPTDRC